MALADLYAKLATLWGGELRREAVLASWGLQAPAGAVDDEADPEGDAWLAFAARLPQ
jgi:hypothetical protein